MYDAAKITADDIRYSGEEAVSLRVVATLTRANGDEVARVEVHSTRYGCSANEPVSLRDFASRQLPLHGAVEAFMLARRLPSP